MQLKYGCNPHQTFASLEPIGAAPVSLLNGTPSIINLLDAPGYPDFVGAALEALNAVETAVIVVSAVNGIEVNTRRMFAEAEKHGLTRLIAINKCDAENVHFPELIAALQEQLRAVQEAQTQQDPASWTKGPLH